MIRTKASAALFSGFWFGLAAWQSLRGFARCGDHSGWVTVHWGLLAVMLVAPLFAVRLAVTDDETTGPPTLDPALALSVLAYAPVMIAMRLLEICGTSH